MILTITAYYGPRQFVLYLFAEEMRTDPHTPVIHFLLYLASRVTLESLIVIAALLLSIGLLLGMLHLKTTAQVAQRLVMSWRERGGRTTQPVSTGGIRQP